MILVDFNQVVLSNLLVQLGNHTNAELEIKMVRHMVLNSLRSYKMKFGDEYGEMIICCDNTNIWRKQIFPYYKASRKKAQANSELNWTAIYECMATIRAEIKEFFPYKVIDVESAEADDVIGVMSSYYSEGFPPILILSGDKDFIQLHKFDNVKQYDAVRNRWITHNDPKRYLQEHIMKGDAGDGIPNILSPDNCFVIGERQKPMTTKRLDHYINTDPKDYEANVLKNYERNRMLIDLDNTPMVIEKKILNQYKEQPKKDRSKLMGYFMKYQLKHLMENIPDF